MALLRRVEKLRRYLRWRLAGPGGLPVWWHVGRPNFGDDINPWFFTRLHRGRVRFATDRARRHVLGAGSILEHATPASVVCGSGFLEPPRGRVAAAEVVAVRGALSANAPGVSADALLGDPLVLIDAFMSPGSKRHRFGFVPHVTSVARWRRLAPRGTQIIDPAWDPWRTIEEIAACDVVLSQSLHGLIVADAFGIPNVWVAPGETMRGGRFKFDDYFSTLDRDKPAVAECPDLFRAPQVFDAEAGRYRFSKPRYLETLAAACDRISARRHDG